MNTMMRISYICFVAVILASSWLGCTGDELVSSTLYKDLFENYNTELLPVCKNGPSHVNVSLNIALRQILILKEKEQIMTSNIWVRMGWTDCQLKWNSSHYGFIDTLRVPYSAIWVPDLALYDSSAEEVMLPGLTEYRAKLSSSGTVNYGFPTVLHSVCRVRVTYFPFDTQECGLKFGSWSHTQLDIDFYPPSPTGDLSSFITNNEWIVTEITAQRNVIMYLEPYADVNFIVIMARRPDHYVMTMLFPCILIGATAAIGFLLPAESGEKISLEVTVLLSQSVFLLVISDFLPPSADDFPILGLYFAVSMLLVGLSLVMAVFVLNVHHRGDVKGKTVPSWTRRYLLQNPRNQCFSNKYDVDSVDTMAKENNGFVQEESRRFTNSVFLGGRNYKLPKSEPNAAYKRNCNCNCNCARPEETNTNINVQNERTQSKNTIAQLDMNGPTEKLHRNDSVFSTGNQQLLEVSLPKEHKRMLRNIERHFALNDEEENVREDWQKLARILDRVCLLLYILCFSIVTLIYVLKLISGREGPSRT